MLDELSSMMRIATFLFRREAPLPTAMPRRAKRLICVRVTFASLVPSLVASFAGSCFAWTINSRELVDVQFFTDDSLIILVSAPHAVEPGIYRWLPDADAPTLLCRLASPASFSFDRKTIIERAAGAASELRLHSPSSCRMLDRIKIDGRVLDADVYGSLAVVAQRLPDSSNELRVYGRPAKRMKNKRAKNDRVLARARIGRNVEIGFAPDGRSIVNFDLSDCGATAWRLPTLASLKLPIWMNGSETTFVPGSTFVKRYVNDTLSVAHWPSGTPVYAMAASRTVRLWQLSVTGRYGALHSADAMDTSATTTQSLDWVDFATQKRVHLATGSIDNATITVTGNRVAWVLRNSEQTDIVSVQFAQINAAGNAIATNGVK